MRRTPSHPEGFDEFDPDMIFQMFFNGAFPGGYVWGGNVKGGHTTINTTTIKCTSTTHTPNHHSRYNVYRQYGNHAHRQQRQQGAQQASPPLAQLLSLLPVLLLFIVMTFNNMSSTPVFSLDQDVVHTQLMFTNRYKVGWVVVWVVCRVVVGGDVVSHTCWMGVDGFTHVHTNTQILNTQNTQILNKHTSMYRCHFSSRVLPSLTKITQSTHTNGMCVPVPTQQQQHSTGPSTYQHTHTHRMRIESDVEGSYKERVQHSCAQERLQQQRLARWGYVEKAKAMELKACEELQQRFGQKPSTLYY